MDSDRIKEIQEETGYPHSIIVLRALNQVWNECRQEKIDSKNISEKRELLISLLEKYDLEYIAQQDAYDILAEDILKAIGL